MKPGDLLMRIDNFKPTYPYRGDPRFLLYLEEIDEVWSKVLVCGRVETWDTCLLRTTTRQIGQTDETR